MVISEKSSSSTIDTCQMNIKIDTDKPVTLSINTTNEHHHLHTTSAPTSIYHSRNPPATGTMNGNNTTPGHFHHHHHTHLYNTATGYNYSSTPPQTPSSAGYYSMPSNNFYHDPYSQCSPYWKAAAVAAAATSPDLAKPTANHPSRLSYPVEQSHSACMNYMSSPIGLSSSQLDIKSEHSSPIKMLLKAIHRRNLFS